MWVSCESKNLRINTCPVEGACALHPYPESFFIVINLITNLNRPLLLSADSKLRPTIRITSIGEMLCSRSQIV
jgi:hypothetical protein